MHPDLYAALAADRICTLHREAETQRMADLATRPRRVTAPPRARQVVPTPRVVRGR
jgi:hypothetical protein